MVGDNAENEDELARSVNKRSVNETVTEEYNELDIDVMKPAEIDDDAGRCSVDSLICNAAFTPGHCRTETCNRNCKKNNL